MSRCILGEFWAWSLNGNPSASPRQEEKPLDLVQHHRQPAPPLLCAPQRPGGCSQMSGCISILIWAWSLGGNPSASPSQGREAFGLAQHHCQCRLSLLPCFALLEHLGVVAKCQGVFVGGLGLGVLAGTPRPPLGKKEKPLSARWRSLSWQEREAFSLAQHHRQSRLRLLPC